MKQNQEIYWIYLSCVSVELLTYVQRFQWDMAKYPIKQSLRNISDIIAKVGDQSLIQNKYIFIYKRYIYVVCLPLLNFVIHLGQSEINFYTWP